MLYNKWDFKACEARKSVVYLCVNEHFEGEYNAEISLLGNFFLFFNRISPHYYPINSRICLHLHYAMKNAGLHLTSLKSHYDSALLANL